MSRTGLAFAGLYGVAVLACGIGAAWAAPDGDARFALMQLPLVPCLAIGLALGLEGWLSGLSWTAAYATLVPVAAALFYGLGWAAGALAGMSGPGRKRI